MIEEHAASVYANALYAAAYGAGEVDRVVEEIADFGQAFSSVPELRHALLDPQVPKSEKQAVLEGVTRGACDTAVNALKVLLEKGRMSIVPEVAARVEHLAERAAAVVEVHVTSAVPLPDDTRAELEALLRKQTEREVHLIDCVDASIIGGLALYVGEGVLVDATVKTRIEQLRDRLSSASTKGASQ